MSSVFSKSKEKRSRSSSNEANNSFVKNVTSRVSGLLPSTITKWFSSPSSSNANGSAQTAEATDSSTEDEATESPTHTQPPSKRMRFTTPGFNHYGPSDTNCVSSGEIHDTYRPYDTVQSPPGRTTFRRETNYVSTPLRAEDTLIDRKDTDPSMFKSQHSVSVIGPTVAGKRKSLFDSPTASEDSIKACRKTACNTMVDIKQPCFKPSLLGSPFYPGRTTYGGASSSYINQPNVRTLKRTVVKESSNSENVISQSTRRIMDLLEHYSSPLSEARRIPQYPRTSRNNSVLSSGPTSPTKKLAAYKTQELYVPSIASILRLKKSSRLMDTTNAARQLIASYSSSDSSPYPSPVKQKETIENTPNNNKFTTKIKTKLTRTRRGESIDTEIDLPAPDILNNAPLQIDQNNLPKISFGTDFFKPTPKPDPPVPVPSSTDDKQEPTANKTQKIIIPIRKPGTVSNINPYIFSSPVRLTNEQPQAVTTAPKFTFGSPERSIDKASEKKNDEVDCFVGAKKVPENKEVASKPASKPKGWNCPDCWVANKPDVSKCACCGCVKPGVSGEPKPAKCSVCKLSDSQPNGDKCVNCAKVTENIALKPLVSKPVTSKWKCDDCWVENDESKEKCACCGANNPKKSATKPPIAKVDTGDEWKCDICWIKNKNNEENCAACGTAKPGAGSGSTSSPQSSVIKQAPASNPPAFTGGFFSTTPSADTVSKVDQTDNKWKCPCCLVRNDNEKTKCACCDTAKPGTVKEEDKKSFNFGINTTSTFKFGIDPKTQEASRKPAEQTTNDTDKKQESETNNNILPKAPAFSFGVPKNTDTNDTKKVEQKTETTPKVSFNFGIPKTSTAPAVTSVFGTPAESVPKKVAEDDEKFQEVPKVDLPAVSLPVQTTQEAPKASNLFTSPITTQLTLEKPAINPFAHKPETAAPALVLNPVSALEKKDALSIAPPVKAPPAYSFPSIKIASNLFSVPATTAAAAATTSIAFGDPTPSASTNSTSLFQKPEAAPTNSTLTMFPKNDGVSLFQKSESSVTTTAPPSLGATAPMFSFTANTQAQPAQPQQESTKFNFTFGANKSDSSSLFKPTFPVTNENKFTLPASNTLGGNNNALGGNGIPIGNALGGNNGLPTGNGLPINPLANQNEMSSSPLANNNSLQPSNPLQSSGIIFGTPAQKENMWASSTNVTNNLFAPNTNATTTSMPKPAFTFGAATPFSANSTPTPVFGGSAQPAIVFGMSNNNNNNGQSSMFSTPQPTANMFGSPQPGSNGVPNTPPMFGPPSVAATPTFGVPNPSIPSFETPSLTPAPAPAFNFGASQPTGVFGFGGQQQQQQQPQQASGMYNFGAAAVNPAGGLQFNMGSQPANANPGARRMRRAFRRNTPR